MGSVLSRVLLQKGHQVLGLDSLLHGGQALTALYLDDNFTFVRGDIRSSEVVNRVVPQVDAVVHLAAIVGDPACKMYPDAARQTNLGASIALIDACRSNGVNRFIFFNCSEKFSKSSVRFL